MQRKGTASIWHEKVYHAASACQAASLSLTARRLHGEKKVCQIERQKTGGCFASWRSRLIQQNPQCSSSTRRMLTFGALKDDGLILLSLEPQREENAHPYIGKCSHRDTMTFAFCPFALIVVHGPGFGVRTLPGKLMQRIAQGFDTGIPSMRFGIVATFIGHRRSTCQCLQAARISVTRTIISQFCQQSRSKAFARTRQGAKQMTVSMGQKKALDLLIVGSNLFQHWQELSDQSQHQARRACGSSLHP